MPRQTVGRQADPAASRTSRQEHYRVRYRELRPGWRDCLAVYRALVEEHVRSGCAVLDLGCGHASWLAPELRVAGLVVGADPDLPALRHYTAASHRVAAVADHLPFRDASFDLVVCAFVFEHLATPAAALTEIRRVLRPGGRLVFLTPNAWNYNVWLIRLVPNRFHHFFTRRLYDRRDRDTYPVRYRMNTRTRLRRALSAAGFRSVDILLNGDPTYLGVNGLLFTVSLVIELALDQPPLRRLRVHLIGTARL